MFDAFSQNFHFYYYGKSNKNQLFSDRKKELLSLVGLGGEESLVSPAVILLHIFAESFLQCSAMCNVSYQTTEWGAKENISYQSLNTLNKQLMTTV